MASINSFDLNKAIKNLQDIDKTVITKALEKSCLLVEGKAKELCPVDTGNLRNSITHEISGNVGIVGTNVEYAPYVEFGTGLFSPNGRKDVPWRYQSADGKWHSTKGQKPQPYLQPALDNNKQDIIKIFEDEIKEAL